MKGKIFGIGVGPGDPELLTLKAVATLQKCDVIAVPKAGKTKTAFNIIKDYVQGKELLECVFAMENDMSKRRAARQIVTHNIIRFLSEGKTVGFITLGDPTTYSTYMYIHSAIADMGFDAEIIPGITSFAAAAAALGVALCEDNEPLLIIPAGHNVGTEELLSYPGNKVIMKSGENLARVLEELKARGYESRTKIASRVTQEGECLYHDIEAFEKSPETGYFTIAIVKEKLTEHESKSGGVK